MVRRRDTHVGTRRRGWDDGVPHGDTLRTNILSARVAELEKQMEMSTGAHQQPCKYTHRCAHAGPGTWTQRHEGKQTQTVGRLVASELSSARIDGLSHPNTHKFTQAKYVLIASVNKYVCVSAPNVSRPHFTAARRRETRVCQCGQVRGPSLPSFSSDQVLPDLSFSCPPLFLTSPSCLLVTFWHVLLSVSLFRPDTGSCPFFFQCKQPMKQMET